MKRFLPVVSFFIAVTMLYSCGVASIHSVHEGEAITKQELMKTPIGTTQADILTRFGEPTRTTFMTVESKKEDVWFYCWKRGTSGSILFGLAGASSAKSRCATFVFKDGKLISKGIGNGSDNQLAPNIRIQKEEIIKHDNENKGLN